MSYHVAVIGATGNVGREILNLLHERKFPIKTLTVLASNRSQGREISFGEEKVVKIVNLETFDFKDVDIAFFAAGSKVSEKYALKASQKAIVIDKTSFFRMRDDIPLIVPEVNQEILDQYPCKIISTPNCITIPLTVILKPLDQIAKIKRIVLSTYQSVSGAGRLAMDELYKQTKGTFVNDAFPSLCFSKPIAFNLIPQIGSFCRDGATEEENKIALETQKILGRSIPIFVTAVRVPVFIGHSIAVSIEFESEITVEKAKTVLKKSSSIQVLDRREEAGYATPLDCVGEDAVFVSRIRQDSSLSFGLGLWIVADNLRKGAALNGIQIAETLIKKAILKKNKIMNKND